MGLNSAAPFFRKILLFTLFYVKSPFTFQSTAEIVKKLKNKEEECDLFSWRLLELRRRVLLLGITQSPMNFLFFCFCRRWISSLWRQFFEWLPHFKVQAPFLRSYCKRHSFFATRRTLQKYDKELSFWFEIVSHLLVQFYFYIMFVNLTIFLSVTPTTFRMVIVFLHS